METTKHPITAHVHRQRRGRLRGHWLMTACGPKRLYEVPKHKLEASIAEMERQYKEQLGKDIKVSDRRPTSRRAFRLRTRHLSLHRLPPLRVCLRRGKQPVARSADPLDPCAFHGEGKRRRLRSRRSLLQSAKSPKKATSTSPSPASSARIRPAPRSVPRAPPGQRKTASW